MNPIVRQAAANRETYSTHTYRGFRVSLRTCSQLDKLIHRHKDKQTDKVTDTQSTSRRQTIEETYSTHATLGLGSGVIEIHFLPGYWAMTLNAIDKQHRNKLMIQPRGGTPPTREYKFFIRSCTDREGPCSLVSLFPCFVSSFLFFEPLLFSVCSSDAILFLSPVNGCWSWTSVLCSDWKKISILFVLTWRIARTFTRVRKIQTGTFLDVIQITGLFTSLIFRYSTHVFLWEYVKTQCSCHSFRVEKCDQISLRIWSIT